MFYAASLVACFTAFRVRELVVSSKTDKGVRALQWGDVLVQGGQLSVYIRTSKTDQLGKGRVVHLDACEEEALCPVCAMECYVVVRGWVGGNPGFFFWHEDGVPLTHYQFWVVTAKVLDSLGLKGLKFGTHSFPIGEASTAAQIGYPEDDIKAFGRWRSGAFRQYVYPLVR